MRWPFSSPELRSSAPPDITVVITTLPPGKLFAGSYVGGKKKNSMSTVKKKR